MPGPGIFIEHIQRADYFGSQGIEVDVPYQLQQVGLLFHQDGLVPILEEMAGPLVAPIEAPGVPGEETSHGRRQRPRPRPDQEVKMIGKQRPRQDREARLRSDRRQSVDPILPIPVIRKDGSALDSPHHDMVQGTRRIQA